MAARISIMHSTYENVMDILVDGKDIDAYSHLRQFMDRPFHEWCSRIFRYIGDEIGGDYEFEFCGSLEETPVMSALAQSEKNCARFIARISPISTPLPERMTSLCKLIKKYGLDFGPPIPCSVNFVSKSIPSSFSGLISQLDVRNSFCKLFFQEKNYLIINDVNFYLVGRMEEAAAIVDAKDEGNPFFILVESEKNGFFRKENNAFIYFVSKNSFFETVFECLLLVPLRDIFIEAAERLLGMSDSAEINNQIRDLMASTPIWRVSAAKEIELGKSAEIRCETSFPNAIRPELIFTSQIPGIVECTQTRVFGKKEGRTKVCVSRKGSSGTLGELDFTVIRRNRIADLMLSEDSVVMGEGEIFRINVDWTPEDADNIDSIRWNAWPEGTVKVEEGLITALKQGEGRIVCSAETISSQCCVLVLPWLNKMSLSEEIL